MAQTDVRQDGADYSRLAGKWKGGLVKCRNEPRGRRIELRSCSILDKPRFHTSK